MTTRLKKKPVNKLSLIVSAVQKLKETKSNKHSSKSMTYINNSKIKYQEEKQQKRSEKMQFNLQKLSN